MRSVLIGLTAAVAGLAAQQPPAAQSVAPATVEAAEAEGAKWPRNPPQPERLSWADAFGPRERQCVRAVDHLAIRSGDFIAGNFQQPILMMSEERQWKRKLWWTPNLMPRLDGV